VDSPKLSPHQLRSIKKSIEDKERRAQGDLPRPAHRPVQKGRRQRPDVDDDDSPETFEKFGGRASQAPPPIDVSSLSLATVIEARGRDTVVALDGRTYLARLSSRLILAGLVSPIVAGDAVRVARLSDDLLRIDGIEQRSSVLARFAGSAEDPIAANVDLVLLVCSPAAPPFRPGLIDRYMVASAFGGLALAICLNKSDLGVPADVDEVLAGYASLGVEVVRTSTRTGQGLDRLKATLRDRITVLTGHSGVGKSSLLNAIEPGLSLSTGEVTRATAGAGKGRHTTTSARLIPLSIEGAYVVDSPGVRAFGLGHLTPAEVVLGFPEVRLASERCETKRCTHRGEPGCAAEMELSGTRFGRLRLASYRSLAGGDRD
jgi:ribosome biogenesis GTPase